MTAIVRIESISEVPPHESGIARPPARTPASTLAPTTTPAIAPVAVIELAFVGPPVLGVGSDGDHTVCLTHGAQATLSAQVEEHDAFRAAIRHVQERVGVAPVAIAHDLHPGLPSTRWALASGVAAYGVQYHHAHVAACLAQHGRIEAVIGVVLGGTGFGDDGTVWGGELLEADLSSARRLAHLRPFALDDDASTPPPWQLALAALIDAGEDDAFEHITGATAEEIRWRVAAWLAAEATPRATGADDFFAAAGALLGISCDDQAHGPSHLEALADSGFAGGGSLAATPFPYTISAPPPAVALAQALASLEPFELDLRATFRAIVDGLRTGEQRACLALRFHATVAAAIAAACRRARKNGAPSAVVLAGRCFENRLLRERTTELLRGDGFDVLSPRDGLFDDRCVSFGQAVVVAYRLARAALRVTAS